MDFFLNRSFCFYIFLRNLTLFIFYKSIFITLYIKKRYTILKNLFKISHFLKKKLKKICIFCFFCIIVLDIENILESKGVF